MGAGSITAVLIALMQGVFCQTWKVMLPQRIMGISGSCVTVPCHYEVPRSQEAKLVNCSNAGVWKKDSHLARAVFSADNPYSNIIQGRIYGDLTKKNCSTVFYSVPENYSGIYFFRLECPNDIQYSFIQGVHITSQTEPSPPQLLPVSQEPEGTLVKLQCSVPMPCAILPPTFSWSPRDDFSQELTRVLQDADGQMTVTSTLSFTASASHHNQSITCSVSYPLTKGGSKKSSTSQRLSVLYAPRFTVATLSISGPVSEGRIVIFKCSSDANPPVSHYTWYRDNGRNLTKKSEGERLVMQVRQNDSGVYLCEAQTMRGSQRSRPVVLEVNAAAGSRDYDVFPYIICGVVLVLCILSVAVGAYKYHSLSTRLKQVELKGEHTYANLVTRSVTSDYEQLQPQKPKTNPTADAHNYENPISLQEAWRNQQQPK